MVCGEKRAQGNTTANKPIDPARPDLHAWIDGWADVLDVVNSHAQVHLTYFSRGAAICVELLRHALLA